MALDPSVATEDTSAAAGEESTSAYTIEITVTADGKISVGVETAQEESEEEGGSEGTATDEDMASEGSEPGAAQPVKSIKEALVLALEIFKNNGEAPAPDTSDSDFASGYEGE